MKRSRQSPVASRQFGGLVLSPRPKGGGTRGARDEQGGAFKAAGLRTTDYGLPSTEYRAPTTAGSAK